MGVKPINARQEDTANAIDILYEEYMSAMLQCTEFILCIEIAAEVEDLCNMETTFSNQ
jgi:hypothetical protein